MQVATYSCTCSGGTCTSSLAAATVYFAILPETTTKTLVPAGTSRVKVVCSYAALGLNASAATNAVFGPFTLPLTAASYKYAATGTKTASLNGYSSTTTTTVLAVPTAKTVSFTILGMYMRSCTSVCERRRCHRVFMQATRLMHPPTLLALSLHPFVRAAGISFTALAPVSPATAVNGTVTSWTVSYICNAANATLYLAITPGNSGATLPAAGSRVAITCAAINPGITTATVNVPFTYSTAGTFTANLNVYVDQATATASTTTPRASTPVVGEQSVLGTCVVRVRVCACSVCSGGVCVLSGDIRGEMREFRGLGAGVETFIEPHACVYALLLGSPRLLCAQCQMSTSSTLSPASPASHLALTYPPGPWATVVPAPALPMWPSSRATAPRRARARCSPAPLLRRPSPET